MKLLVLNGKEYKAKEFDFNMICDLEDMGVDIDEAAEKPMTMIRSYLAVCMEKSKSFAGSELQEHIVKGGSISDVMDVMSEMMEKSDFFRALSKETETETAKVQKK